MKSFKLFWVTASVCALLTACGGGGSDTGAKSAVSRVWSYGDSLVDVGTFGAAFRVSGTRFTYSVHGGDDRNWTERVAASFGLGAQCNYYTFNGTSFVNGTTCTNLGVGAAKIVYSNDDFSVVGDTTASAFSVVKQLTDGLAAAGGTYAASDLVLIDGGGNDLNAVLTAVGALGSSPANPVPFVKLMDALLGAGYTNAQFAALAGQGVTGLNAAAYIVTNGYMPKLADTFFAAIESKVLSKGAQRVAILNMPAIKITPSVITKTGGALNALIDAASVSYNTRLQSLASASTYAGKVVVVDFYGSMLDEKANPAQYGLTNVTTPLCTDANPSADPNCTDTYLSAHPPTGVTDPTWWTKYAFADGFHPTPYGYQLLAQLVNVALARKGWL